MVFIFSTRPGILPKVEALRTLYEGKKIIVGRDKLDVVKGVLQKVCLFFSSQKLFFFNNAWFIFLYTKSYAHSRNYFRIILNGSGTSL